MRILYAAPEVAPFAKTGGLADVAGALPATLGRLGHEVKVVLPKYAAVSDTEWGLKPRGERTVKLAGGVYPFRLSSCPLPGSSAEALFLSNADLFDRPALYREKGRDYPDNLIRFAAFSRAVLEIPKILNWPPEVIHGNDWQTALIFAYLKAHFGADPAFRNIGTVFTVHNLGYMGQFPGPEFSGLGLPPEYFTAESLEYFGNVNLLKSGLVFAGIVNTVSPSYAREIQTPEFGRGLEGVLRARREDLYGILNGVDYREWDPTRDPRIPRRYQALDLKGKEFCKKALQRELRLPQADAPLIGMITRLTEQKGIDLVIDGLNELMRLDLQMVVLGSGDPDIQAALRRAVRRHPGRLSVRLAFDEALAHRIEAGTDIFLMPSRYEPCGLNQLYSLRYGTIPVVRKTGGLADSVVDALPSRIASGEATGFVFEGATVHALLSAVRLAVLLYRDRPVWEGLMKAAMAADFSWDRSAREYLKLYRRAVAKAGSKAQT